MRCTENDAVGDGVGAGVGGRRGRAETGTRTLAERHVRVLTSFIQFNTALTKLNEALTKPYHGLIPK